MKTKLTLLTTIFSLAASLAFAQAPARNRVDVEHYDIDASLNPVSQTLSATVKMRLMPLDDRIGTVAVDFNDALRVASVTDQSGAPVPFTKSGDFQYRLSFSPALEKGKAVTLSFAYEGKFDGREESPVYGIRFAGFAPDSATFLYPARWFPVNEYTSDRYTMNLNVSVPSGYRVVSTGNYLQNESGGQTTYKFSGAPAALLGSFSITKLSPQSLPVEGVTSVTFFKTENAARPMAEMVAKAMNFLSDLNGKGATSSLTLVETSKGFPGGYSAPGVIFFSPNSLSTEPSPRMVINQVARQWWGGSMSPISRNHIWLVNGLARYSEALYFESTGGPSALESEMRDVYVEALTQPDPPLIQSSRYEDYSPEYWAATAGKGSSVLNMLRNLVGKDKFAEIVKQFARQYAGKQVSTGDFRKVAEQVYGQELGYFFLQWIESSGAPEFKLTYTVFRTGKGFRVMGKVSQDLDTFRMPVRLKIETEGNPEEKIVEVVGTSSEFSVDTFGKPKSMVLDPDMQVLRYDDQVRVSVAIRKGEQFAEVSDFEEALKEYQKAMEVNRNSSLAHYRVAEIFFLRGNNQSAANEFREVLNGDLEPKWTEVWSHIRLGQIFDITSQRERAVSEYNQAIRTKDNTQGALEEAAKYVKTPYKRQNSEN